MTKKMPTRAMSVVVLIGMLGAVVTAAPAIATATTTTGGVNRSSDSSSSTAKFNLKWTARAEWGAAPARRLTPINDGAAVTHVIVHHTVRPGACRPRLDCPATVRAMQRAHQQDRAWDDIGYNFLIGGGSSGTAAATANHGGDGDSQLAEIYEGRGFNVSGAHAPGYNGRSMGIALIGDWSVDAPPQSMLDKLRQLIAHGVQRGFIRADYKLLGHRQVRATACPGAGLFNEIKQWTHFAATA